MTTQLTLLAPAPAPWQLDDRTRTIGLQGLAAARSALAGTHRAIDGSPAANALSAAA